MLSKSDSVLRIIQDILTGKIRNIVFLSGAGISVPSGIPDFRSANGLYKTLKPELLTVQNRNIVEAIRRQPTLVVDYDLFRTNQFPYLEVRRNLILGIAEKKWKPTLGHALMRQFHQHHQLRRIYTQNIDGIDHQLNLDRIRTSWYSKTKEDNLDLIINVHGTLHKIECENCKDTSYTLDEFCDQVRTKIKNIYDENDPIAPKESSKIYCKRCHLPQVKPATVMFGRSYSNEVWQAVSHDFPNNVDLLIVIGTSLQVSPANTLVSSISSTTPVLVINNQSVGEEFGLDFGEITPCNENDFEEYLKCPTSLETQKDGIILGDCDEASYYLLQQLGWLNEVRQFQDLLCENSQQLLSSADEK